MLSRRIHDAIVAPIVLPDRTVQVGASIGVVFIPQMERMPTIPWLHDQADKRSYRIKLLGGGVWGGDDRDDRDDRDDPVANDVRRDREP